MKELLGLVMEEDLFKAASPEDIQGRDAERKRIEQEEVARQEKVRKEREAAIEKQRKEFKKKSHEAMKLLGLTKIVDNPYNWSNDTLTIGTNKAGEEIHMSWGEAENKIRVDGEYPKAKHGDYHRQQGAGNINISAKKTAEQIATEIGRRFMPSYKEAFAGAQKSAAEHDTYMDTTINALRALKGAKLDDYEIRNKKISKPYKSGGEARWDAVAYGSSVNMDIHDLTVDQAVRIVKIARERQPKTAQESRGMFETIFEGTDGILQGAANV